MELLKSSEVLDLRTLKARLDEITGNGSVKIVINREDWESDNGLYSKTLVHNLGKKILYIGGYDLTTNKSLFMSYTVINSNTLKVTVEESVDAEITIVSEGNITDQSSINDNIEGLTTTWSSEKIKSELDKKSSGGGSAEETTFNNSSNGMIATNVQDAIEENKTEIEANKTSILNLNQNINTINQDITNTNQSVSNVNKEITSIKQNISNINQEINGQRLKAIQINNELEDIL